VERVRYQNVGALQVAGVEARIDGRAEPDEAASRPPALRETKLELRCCLMKSVSVPVISPSSNQRRAMPVVTMTTFQLGVSGVASRSRLTTPTRNGSARIVSAMGRIP